MCIRDRRDIARAAEGEQTLLVRLHVDRRRLAHGQRRDARLPAREKKRLPDRFGARTATAPYARNDTGHDKAKRLGRRRLHPHAQMCIRDRTCDGENPASMHFVIAPGSGSTRTKKRLSLIHI